MGGVRGGREGGHCWLAWGLWWKGVGREVVGREGDGWWLSASEGGFVELAMAMGSRESSFFCRGEALYVVSSCLLLQAYSTPDLSTGGRSVDGKKESDVECSKQTAKRR